MVTLVDKFENQKSAFALLKSSDQPFNFFKHSFLTIFFLLPQLAFGQIDNNFFNGGGIRVGDSTTACAGNGGGIRFDVNSSDGGGLQYCDGTTWLNILTGTIAGDVSQGGNSFSAPMIIGTNDSNTLSFETGGTTRMTINTSGYVGIGSASPASALDVVGDIKLTGDLYSATTATTSEFRGATKSYDPTLQINSSAASNPGSMIVTMGENAGSYISFGRESNVASKVEYMRLVSGGTLGIGTNNPDLGFMLDVRAGASETPLLLRNGDTNTLSGNKVQMALSYNANNTYKHWITTGHQSSAAGNSINFFTNDGTLAGAGVFPTNAVHGMTIRNGRVGIATTSPTVALDVVGDVQYTGTITDVSDRRLKENILPLDNALQTIAAIDGVSFIMKDDENRRIEFGVIAQDVEEVIPELVHTADDPMKSKSVNYIGFIGWIIEAIKDLISVDEDLQSQIDEKDKRISDLEAEIKTLKALIEEKLQ